VIAAAGSVTAALGLYLWLVAVTGVRRGELCALQIRDIDLDRGLLRIAFNYVVRGGRRVRKDAKNHQERDPAIDADTCTLIRNHLDETRAALATVGIELADDAYLFSNDPVHAGRGTRTGPHTRSPTPRRPPGPSSTSRDFGTTPPASCSRPASTCTMRMHVSRTRNSPLFSVAPREGSEIFAAARL
jgi:hypothetical protein